MGMVAILINEPVTIGTQFQSSFNRRLHMKFEGNWPWGEVVQRCGRTDDDGRRTAIDHSSSSWALLRWANKKKVVEI